MAREGSFGGAVLIVLGIVFLLANFDLVALGDLARFWPLILIAVGARLVFAGRGRGSGAPPGPPPPTP